MNVAELDRFAGSVLSVLWRSSWQAGVLAVMVVVLQWALRNQLSARWRHALWTVVLLRLLVPVTPASPFSLFNFAPAQPTFAGATIIVPVVTSPPLAVSHAPIAPTPTQTPWMLILASVWVTGVIVMLARIACASVHLSLLVRRMSNVRDPGVLSLIDRCREELRVRRKPDVLTSADVSAPALMGFIRPRLLLPESVLTRFDPTELRLILLHELAHLKRHDVAVNWVASVLQAVHWFNPIVHLAFARLRSDRELAADELVLAHSGADQRNTYGQTIVKLLQTLAPGRAGFSGMVGILERAHPMKRRITMIAQFTGITRRGTFVLASVALVVLIGVGLTDRVRGDTPALTAKPATRPVPASPDDATRNALAKVTEDGRSPSPEQIDAAKERLSDEIRKKWLFYNSQGQPANASEVDKKVEAQLQALDALLADQKRQSTDDLTAWKQVDGIDAEAKAFNALHKRLPELRFDAIGFADVVDFLRDVTGANITVNWRALEAAGIDRNTPVSLQLKDIRLEQALKHLLADVGGGSVKLAFGVSDGSIIVSTEEQLASVSQFRAYDIADLGDDGGQITEIVNRHVKGLSAVETLSNRLLVSGTTAQQLEVAQVLDELRRAKRAIAPAKSEHPALDKAVEEARRAEAESRKP